MNTFLYTKLIFMFSGCLLIRPSVFGQQWTTLGVLFIGFAFFVHLIEHSVRREIRLNRTHRYVLVFSVLVWLYFLVHSHLLNVQNFDFVIKLVMTMLAVIPMMAILLSDETLNYKFFRGMIKFLIFISISYYVSFILSLFLSWDKIAMFDVVVEGYGVKSIYFPLTHIYGFQGFDQLPRLGGFFRESGILQMFIIWAYFNLHSYNLDTKKVKISLIFGLIATFSTIGAAIFLAVFAIKLFFNQRKFISLVIMPIGIYAAYNLPLLGIKAKASINTASISDRSMSMSEGIKMLAKHPFGVGLYNGELGTNSGINLIANSQAIGIIGIILILTLYYLPMITAEDKKSFFLSSAPIVFTSLFSQPLIDAPLVYILLLATYKPHIFKQKKLKESIHSKFYQVRSFKSTISR